MSGSFYISEKTASEEELTIHMMTMIVGLLFNQQLTSIWYNANEKTDFNSFLSIIDKRRIVEEGRRDRKPGGVVAHASEDGYMRYTTSLFGPSIFVVNKKVVLENIKQSLEPPFIIFVAPGSTIGVNEEEGRVEKGEEVEDQFCVCMDELKRNADIVESLSKLGACAVVKPVLLEDGEMLLERQLIVVPEKEKFNVKYRHQIF